jgi:hypothetical protein
MGALEWVAGFFSVAAATLPGSTVDSLQSKESVMASVSMKTTIGASADDVWRTISDFNGAPKYIAALLSSSMEGSGVGALRTVTLEGDVEVVERLESLDDAARTLSYSIVRSPLPLEGYVATMVVRDLGEGRCELEWSSTFEPKAGAEDEARQLVEGVYSAGFEGLKGLLEA